jgi:hypothetical protein
MPYRDALETFLNRTTIILLLLDVCLSHAVQQISKASSKQATAVLARLSLPRHIPHRLQLLHVALYALELVSWNTEETEKGF